MEVKVRNIKQRFRCCKLSRLVTTGATLFRYSCISWFAQCTSSQTPEPRESIARAWARHFKRKEWELPRAWDQRCMLCCFFPVSIICASYERKSVVTIPRVTVKPYNLIRLALAVTPALAMFASSHDYSFGLALQSIRRWHVSHV